ncbi:hypothetical protein HPB50_013410 [Hyalomma asiaticum]|uniref:Uncharacterized protein n=1 Tax=Hyalomma asiaticum TaxID=266040 RepID=A0ACB7RJP4_HYAAI|nr:hypothetical protein HPB50_013410 [Hyalomma asiaticum]
MPEVVTVEGMDINPDEFHGAGWTTALGARRKRDPARNAAAAAATETNASAAKKPGFNAPADGAGPTDAARSRSSSRRPGKQTTWADMVDNNGSTTSTKQGTVVASCTPHKRRAIVIQSEDEPSDVDDITSEVSEAPSNASASDSNAKKRSKKKRKCNTFQSAITEIKEALMQICGRLDRLERSIAQPKATRTISTPDPGIISSPGPNPALPTHPQPPGPIEKSQLFTNAKKAITVDPIPKNIHPTHNEGRRKARAKAVLDKIKHYETKVLFVDAARYWNQGAYAVSVVDAHGSLVNAATVVTNFTHEAEEMAIVVALRSCMGASVIYSHSRTAI